MAQGMLNTAIWHMSLSVAVKIFSGLALYWLVRVYPPKVVREYHRRYFADEDLPTCQRASWLVFMLLGCVVAYMRHQVPQFAIPGLVLIIGAAYGAKFVDSRWQVIPDRFHVIGGLGTLMFLAAIAVQSKSILVIADAIWGLFLVLGLAALTFVYQKWRQRDGLGMGDVKLLLWLWPLLGMRAIPMILLASVLAALWLAPRLLFKRGSLTSPFAFGPFLYYSFLICFLAKWTR